LAAISGATVQELEAIARRVRRDIIRMTAEANSGHPAGSLSCADILTALYFRVLRHDRANPAWPDRDRFVMSKGTPRRLCTPCWRRPATSPQRSF